MELLDPSLKNAPVVQIIFPKQIPIVFTGLVEYRTLGCITKWLQKVIFKAPTAAQICASGLEGSDIERHEETQNQPLQTGITAIATGTEDMGNDIVLNGPLPPLASSCKWCCPMMDGGSQKKRANATNRSDLITLECWVWHVLSAALLLSTYLSFVSCTKALYTSLPLGVHLIHFIPSPS